MNLCHRHRQILSIVLSHCVSSVRLVQTSTNTLKEKRDKQIIVAPFMRNLPRRNGLGRRSGVGCGDDNVRRHVSHGRRKWVSSTLCVLWVLIVGSVKTMTTLFGRAVWVEQFHNQVDENADSFRRNLMMFTHTTADLHRPNAGLRNNNSTNTNTDTTIDGGDDDDWTVWNFNERKKVLSNNSGYSPLVWLARRDFKKFKNMFKDSLKVVTEFDVDRVWNTEHNSSNHADVEVQVDLIYESSLCSAAEHFRKHGSKKRHVLFVDLNENWGAASVHIPGRTKNLQGVHGGDFYRRIKVCNLLEYLDNDNLLAAITSQHHGIDHPKLHSIPLGMYSMANAKQIPMDAPPVPKKQLVMLSVTSTDNRRAQIEEIQKNFKGLRNTYNRSAFGNYWDELARSKFVFSPAGLGWDCYRHWESIAFGSIPIIEHYDRKDGWFRVFDDLPVLWVQSFDVVTPEILEAEYKRITSIRNYRFHKLTAEYWVQFVNSFRFGSFAGQKVIIQ